MSARVNICDTNEATPTPATNLKVRFEGLNTTNATDALKFLGNQGVQLPADQMPTAEVLAKAVLTVKELLNRNGYVHAIVDATRDDQEKAVTFIVVEGSRPPVSEIRFDGNRIFSSQDLLSRMQEYLSEHGGPGSGYNAELFELAIHRLTDSIRSEGFLRAKTGEPKLEIAGGGLAITIPIDEGPVYRLGEIKISGAEHITPERIRSMLSLRRGEIAKADVIGEWLYEDLKSLYETLGFIQFTAEPEPEFRPIAEGQTEGTVDFKVYIEEGPQFKIRSITLVAGDSVLKDVRELLLIHEGDVYDHRLFEQSVIRLNETGLFETIDPDKDSERRGDNESALIDLVIKVNYKVRN